MYAQERGNQAVQKAVSLRDSLSYWTTSAVRKSTEKEKHRSWICRRMKEKPFSPNKKGFCSKENMTRHKSPESGRSPSKLWQTNWQPQPVHFWEMKQDFPREWLRKQIKSQSGRKRRRKLLSSSRLMLPWKLPPLSTAANSKEVDGPIETMLWLRTCHYPQAWFSKQHRGPKWRG